MILTIFLPKYFINLIGDIVKTCKNKEEVAQAVDKFEHVGIYVSRVGKSYDASFAAAAHGAAHVGYRTAVGSTGKYEV